MKISLLISPEVKGAYFSEYIECSLAEFRFCFADVEASHEKIGMLNFIVAELNEKQLHNCSKLSFFQGAFERTENGFIPLSISPDFKLHDNFIFGSKFKGKTNERFTQMMINIGLASIEKKEKVKVLDPMCGRGTTLLWSLRYGMHSRGIEVDPKALGDINQIVKKWSKICEINSKVHEGFVGKKTKTNVGKFLEFSAEGTSFKVICGNSTEATKLLNAEKFDLIISDIPYGIQHHANMGAKNPMKTLEACLPEWKKSLAQGGSIVIGFNSNNPKRSDLATLSSSLGLEVLDFTSPHRMSESIVRDIIVLK